MNKPDADRLYPGRPYPLGATSDGLGVNFAVFSAHATRIDLCVFDSTGRRELQRLPLPECTDEVWHGYLPNAGPGLLYGYRAHGPYDPQRGHRFNPHKLLLDPYARQLSGQLRWSDALFGYRMQHQRADLSFDRRDSAPAMPKAVVVDDAFNWGEGGRPDTPWAETIIYEAHVRGLTMRLDPLRADIRGSFAALSDRRVIEHLHHLGVTSIELLPIQAFLQDRFLVERGLRNYWGYNTLAFFAPEPAYLASGGATELRGAIRRLHAADIEVILDVVYNHTCEGNELGPTLSWRGLDNASYYQLVPGEERHYVNHSGCGNALNLAHPRVLQMVMDSLRYWATAYHIDGFRFDLGVTLGRDGDGFDPGAGFFDAVRQDPILSRLKLISEPWDVGPDGYQLGNHPPGFAEWNDRYRDTVRRFWRGDPGQRGDLAARLVGSADFFDHRHRRPWSSINFLTSHDGFTLHDLVSYNDKHNAANGEENRDGHSENVSANWGVEGDTDDPAILALRMRVRRAMLATLYFSFGTPMVLAGDEFGHSQQGNNNAYCQDNEISWLDWRRARAPQALELQSYMARLAALRRRHASLRFSRYTDASVQLAPDIQALSWFDYDATDMVEPAWANPEGRALTLRRAVRDDDGRLELTALLINGSDIDLEFTPPPAGPCIWHLDLDTADLRRVAHPLDAERVTVGARSVILLIGHEQYGDSA